VNVVRAGLSLVATVASLWHHCHLLRQGGCLLLRFYGVLYWRFFCMMVVGI